MSTGALGTDFVVEQALKLPVPDRVEVLHRVWDSLPADSGSIFLSAELCAELDRRISVEDANPNDEFTGEEVKAGAPRQP